MILTIDAHNLRSGGGLYSLYYLLRRAPGSIPFERVVVFSGPGVGALFRPLLAGRPWLELFVEPDLGRSLLVRRRWHEYVFPERLTGLGSTLLFAPGGFLPRRLPPSTRTVLEVHNMLLYQPEEAGRYGWSVARARLLQLRRRQVDSVVRADGVLTPSVFGRDTLLWWMARAGRVCRFGGHARVSQGWPGHERAGGGAISRKIEVVPHGVDDVFRDVGRARSFRESPVRLLYVSTIDVYKHQDVLVRALAKLKCWGYRGLTLELAGASYPRAAHRLKREIRAARVGDLVRWRGLLPHDSLPGRYARANVGLFLSTCETCPGALLEMMAAGLPIICSPRRPMTDICGGVVEYADPEDEVSVAEAIARLVDSPARRGELGGLAEAQVESLRWEETSRRTFAFLKRAAASGPV